MYGQLMDGREVDSAYAVPNFGRFRVNMFLALGAVRAVLRSIPSKKPKFEEIGLPEVLEQLSMERRGLLLVTGITGSGKSTTLAAMVDYINRTRNDHIITIEDPIEFTHDDIGCVVSQREIGHDSPSFATALRAALREDPDVILVGEMRDPETMSVALHAAETGHLVFSTLHTLNASETVNRIIGTFPPHQEQQIRDQLAAVIVGIVSQRLIPKIGGEGRIPAVEILVGTGAIKDCIREAKRTPEIPAFIAQGQSQYGMQTFDQCLLKLYRDGIISYETAREAATNADDFDLKVRGIFSTGEQSFEQRTTDRAPVSPTGSSFFKRSYRGRAVRAELSTRGPRGSRPLISSPAERGPRVISPHDCAGAARRRPSPRKSSPISSPAVTSTTRPSLATGSPPARRAATAPRACARSSGRGEWPRHWSRRRWRWRAKTASSSAPARSPAGGCPRSSAATACGPPRASVTISCAAAMPRRWSRGSSASASASGSRTDRGATMSLPSQARLGRRGPSPATACSAHHSARRRVSRGRDPAGRGARTKR
jgi:twitching motility protein PilT